MAAKLRGKFLRLIALLALVAGLLAPVAPSLAAAPAHQTHSGMDCGDHKPAPGRHVPNAMDCCVANICAMNLALPTALSGFTLPGIPERSRYTLSGPLPPAGIEAAPITHPPKSPA
jgi:hypothetical protein